MRIMCTIEEACDELEKDDVIMEWQDYITQVSQWELDNYLAKY